MIDLDWGGRSWWLIIVVFVPMTVVYCSNTGPPTQIANVRQISIVSQEDIERIALAMGISEFNPQLLGPNLVVTGCNDFAYVPSSSRLQSDHVTTLIVDMKNYFCHQIGMTIECDLPKHGKAFKQYAKVRRGITAWVERPEKLALGDKIRLHRPKQRVWQPSDQDQLI